MTPHPSCPVCKAPCLLLDTVDFNKSCEEGNGKFLPPSGIAVSYVVCSNCGFCFAPDIAKWTLQEFSDKIYNGDYVQVDPEYVDQRPRNNATSLVGIVGDKAPSIRHLDYGGGSGLLSSLLRESRWQSVSYDPFVNRDVAIGSLGQFDLVTAFEVFEHVPDVQQLMADLRSLLAPGGIVLFSTLASDGNIRLGQKLTWWYASPRNGHISLFSKRSLARLAQDHGFKFGSFSEGFHVLFTQPPAWASHFLRG